MITVNPASNAQLDELAQLFDLYREFYGQSSDLRRARLFLAERMTNNESIVLVATIDGRAVGFTQLYPSFSSVSMQRIWILNDLFVAVEARRQGVAHQLMEAAKTRARLTGAVRIELATQVENSSAQQLYESLGYVRDREFYHYSLSI